MNEIAFDLYRFDLDVEPRFLHYWDVIGRAINDIYIGDRLEIRLPDETSMGDDGSFVVIAIELYNRSAPILERGMTGRLTLEGDQGDLLKDTRFLVHTTTWSPPDDEHKAAQF